MRVGVVLSVIYLLYLVQVWATCDAVPSLSSTTGYAFTQDSCPLPANVTSKCTLWCAGGYGLKGTLSFTCSELGAWVQSGTFGSCVACLPGTFSMGRTECQNCPSGTTSGAMATSCTQTTCDRNVTCNGHGTCTIGASAPNAPCLCDALFTGTNCNQCITGAVTTNDGCACPAGSTQTLTPNNVVACTPCAAGTYSGGAVCSQCPPGKYTNTSGNQECASCPANTFAQYPASTACTPCPDGSNSVTGSSQCTPICGAGNYYVVTTDGGLSTRKCTQCAAGKYSTVATTDGCINCPKGTFSSTSGAALCQPCGLNSFASVEGQTACVPCAFGYVTTTIGASNCTIATSACDTGAYPTSTGCQLCPAGKHLIAATSSNSIPCETCKAGTYAPQGSVSCLACPINTFSADNAGSCTNCAAGTFAPVPASTTCTTPPTTVCAVGTYWSANANLCLNCQPGKYNPYENQNACITCANGTFASTEGAVACTPCPAGTFGNQPGATTCFNCDAQTYSNVGATNCTTQPTCPAGQFYDGSACQACAAGKYSPSITVAQPGVATECKACPPGTYGASTGRSSCEPCAVGQYQANSGQLACVNCAVNFYNPTRGQSSCLACIPPAYSNNQGATNCVTPDAPTLSPGTPACAAGFYPVNGQCTACPMGKVNQQSGAASCLKCPAGRFSSITGAIICNFCVNGTFSAEGASVCTRCLAGTYSGTGASTCLNCPATITADTLLALNTSSCGGPVCTPSCSNTQVCRRENGSDSYSAPKCYDTQCTGCTNDQRCINGQCATPTANITQDVVNTLVKSGIDPLTIATSVGVTTSKGNDVFIAGSSVTTVTSTDGSAGTLTFGANDGAGQQPATVVITGATSTPQLTSRIEKGILIAGDNVTIGNATVGGGSTGSSNLIIQFDTTKDNVHVRGDNVTLLPDAAVFVSGPGTLDANFSGNSTLTVQVGTDGSKLRGDIKVQVAIQAGDDGSKNLTVDGHLRISGNLTGQADINITKDGNLTLSTTGRVDSHIEVHGVLKITSNVSVDATVELKGDGTTSVNTITIPHIEVIGSCELGHTIQFTVPGAKNGNDLDKLKASGIILTYGPSTTTSQFQCTIEFVAANGDSVTATVVGGAQTGAKRRLLAANCNTATWNPSNLSYTTCGSPNSAVSLAASPLLLLSLAVLALLSLLS